MKEFKICRNPEFGVGEIVSKHATYPEYEGKTPIRKDDIREFTQKHAGHFVQDMYSIGEPIGASSRPKGRPDQYILVTDGTRQFFIHCYSDNIMERLKVDFLGAGRLNQTIESLLVRERSFDAKEYHSSLRQHMQNSFLEFGPRHLTQFEKDLVECLRSEQDLVLAKISDECFDPQSGAFSFGLTKDELCNIVKKMPENKLYEQIASCYKAERGAISFFMTTKVDFVEGRFYHSAKGFDLDYLNVLNNLGIVGEAHEQGQTEKDECLKRFGQRILTYEDYFRLKYPRDAAIAVKLADKDAVKELNMLVAEFNGLTPEQKKDRLSEYHDKFYQSMARR